MDSAKSLRLEFSGTHQPHILRIHAPQKPAGITLDGESLAEGAAWSYEPGAQRLILRTRTYRTGQYSIAWP